METIPNDKEWYTGDKLKFLKTFGYWLTLLI